MRVSAGGPIGNSVGQADQVQVDAGGPIGNLRFKGAGGAGEHLRVGSGQGGLAHSAQLQLLFLFCLFTCEHREN